MVDSQALEICHINPSPHSQHIFYTLSLTSNNCCNQWCNTRYCTSCVDVPEITEVIATHCLCPPTTAAIIEWHQILYQLCWCSWNYRGNRYTLSLTSDNCCHKWCDNRYCTSCVGCVNVPEITKVIVTHCLWPPTTAAISDVTPDTVLVVLMFLKLHR